VPHLNLCQDADSPDMRFFHGIQQFLKLGHDSLIPLILKFITLYPKSQQVIEPTSYRGLLLSTPVHVAFCISSPHQLLNVSKIQIANKHGVKGEKNSIMHFFSIEYSKLGHQ
jgi:hypothetical protein